MENNNQTYSREVLESIELALLRLEILEDVAQCECDLRSIHPLSLIASGGVVVTECGVFRSVKKEAA